MIQKKENKKRTVPSWEWITKDLSHSKLINGIMWSMGNLGLKEYKTAEKAAMILKERFDEIISGEGLDAKAIARVATFWYIAIMSCLEFADDESVSQQAEDKTLQYIM